MNRAPLTSVYFAWRAALRLAWSPELTEVERRGAAEQADRIQAAALARVLRTIERGL